MESDEPRPENNFLREWIHWIMGGLIVWGLLLGLGAYLFHGDANTVRQGKAETEAILRGIIVAACAVAFVGFWWVMLATRGARSTKFQGPSAK
jgi:hypothetical protein